MPLDPAEAVRLSAKAIELGVDLRAALDPDGIGGKGITKAEGAKLLRLAAAFVLALVVDLLD